MKHLACITFTLVIVLLVYVHRLIHTMLPAQYRNITLPFPRQTHALGTAPGMQPQQRSCKNILQALPQGRWRQRDGITYKDIIDYNEVVMKMRLQKGWPPSLYHGDLRCGTKYPLPRVVHTNKTEGYYLDIPSQCDILSNSPCCRDDIGWCGSGWSFCDCETCTDYRRFIPAELAVWETSDGCVIPKVDAREACNDLSNRFTSVTFLGDSLVRHLFTALLILLTMNIKSGGLKVDLNQKYVDLCGGENQFVDSACHNKLAMTWNDVIKHKEYCSNLAYEKKPRISFEQTHSIKQLGLAKEVITRRLYEPKPLIILGLGVHDSFNYTRISKEFLQPIVQLRRAIYNPNSTFIWLNTHSAGPLKPTEFREIQGNKKIQVFNRYMQQYCEMNGFMVIDTFNLTSGIHSFDGTHYGYEINRLKAQLLLNGLKEDPYG